MSTATLVDRLVDAGPGPGPLRWVVGIGLATGLLGAALLTLVVFAGAGEHAITGSALLAFGFGWAVLAVLSVRTDARQGWALVPAVPMGATGLGLLTFAPGDGALTAAGWVWPPVALALAAWMGVRTHRVRAGRWLLYPVVALLAAVAVGGGYATSTPPCPPSGGPCSCAAATCSGWSRRTCCCPAADCCWAAASPTCSPGGGSSAPA